jgi:hypothetical protein
MNYRPDELRHFIVNVFYTWFGDSMEFIIYFSLGLCINVLLVRQVRIVLLTNQPVAIFKLTSCSSHGRI